MTEREAIEAILEQWKTGWQTLHPGSANDDETPRDLTEPLCVPWTTENEAFTTDQLGALGAWARISVSPSTGDQATCGTIATEEYRGSIMVQLFAPANAGVGLLAGLAEDVRTALHRKRLGSLITYVGRSEPVPTDGAWAMRSVVIPYLYTQTQ